ncbi:hypothetical protein SPHINGOAX6_70383 [Sphingomonas sp. AX6]|nr:hypothetical protein SPHINGOAX6_70383 [Sphingomonas sp. AX6]
MVIDHSRLESDLMKDGIDVHLYWNVRRLTPAVWLRGDGVWFHDYDLEISDNPEIRLDAEYCLDSITSLILQKE